MSEVTFVDLNGVEIKEGDRVSDGAGAGVITLITDFDGDTDDYGRLVGINPHVCVQFENGDDDNYSTRSTATGPWDHDSAPYACEDIERCAVQYGLPSGPEGGHVPVVA